MFVDKLSSLQASVARAKEAINLIPLKLNRVKMKGTVGNLLTVGQRGQGIVHALDGRPLKLQLHFLGLGWTCFVLFLPPLQRFFDCRRLGRHHCSRPPVLQEDNLWPNKCTRQSDDDDDKKQKNVFVAQLWVGKLSTTKHFVDCYLGNWYSVVVVVAVITTI